MIRRGEPPPRKSPLAETTRQWASRVDGWFSYTVEASRDTCRLTPSYLSDDDHMSIGGDEDDVLHMSPKQTSSMLNATTLSMPNIIVPPSPKKTSAGESVAAGNKPSMTSGMPTLPDILDACSFSARNHRSIVIPGSPRNDDNGVSVGNSPSAWSRVASAASACASQYVTKSPRKRGNNHTRVKRCGVVETMCFDAKDDGYDSDTFEALPLPPVTSNTSERAQIQRELLAEQHRTSHASSWNVLDRDEEDEDDDDDGTATNFTNGSGTTGAGDTSASSIYDGLEYEDPTCSLKPSCSDSIQSYDGSSLLADLSSSKYDDASRSQYTGGSRSQLSRGINARTDDSDDASSYSSANRSGLGVHSHNGVDSDSGTESSDSGSSCTESDESSDDDEPSSMPSNIENHYKRSLATSASNTTIHTMSMEYRESAPKMSTDPYLIVTAPKPVVTSQAYNPLTVASAASNVSQSNEIGAAIRAALSAQHGLEMEAPPSLDSIMVSAAEKAATQRYNMALAAAAVAENSHYNVTLAETIEKRDCDSTADPHRTVVPKISTSKNVAPKTPAAKTVVTKTPVLQDNSPPIVSEPPVTPAEEVKEYLKSKTELPQSSRPIQTPFRPPSGSRHLEQRQTLKSSLNNKPFKAEEVNTTVPDTEQVTTKNTAEAKREEPSLSPTPLSESTQASSSVVPDAKKELEVSQRTRSIIPVRSTTPSRSGRSRRTAMIEFAKLKRARAAQAGAPPRKEDGAEPTKEVPGPPRPMVRRPPRRLAAEKNAGDDNSRRSVRSVDARSIMSVE